MANKKYQINLLANAKKAEIGNSFEGELTFKNEQKEEVKFNYKIKKVQFEYKSKKNGEDYVDIYFSNENGSFTVKGSPVDELHKLKDGEKLIFALSMNLIPLLIHEVKDSLRFFPEVMTEKLGITKINNLVKKDLDFAVEETGYQLIFGVKKS